MFTLLKNYSLDFLLLLYPNLCVACKKSLVKGENVICSFCLFHLPKTFFHNDLNNTVAKSFWGRVQIENAASCFYFTKGNKVQKLLHQLKYKGKKEVGEFIGKYYGFDLRITDGFKAVEIIIPVPLHKKKLRKRGFNQSEVFAKGLAESMHLEINTDCLYRKTASATQTRKSRFKRWENVEDIFAIRHPEQIAGKHVLLVDDVITTGATMEACAEALLRVPGVKVSVVSIAYSA